MISSTCLVDSIGFQCFNRNYLVAVILKAFGQPTFLLPQEVITVVSIKHANTIANPFFNLFIIINSNKCLLSILNRT